MANNGHYWNLQSQNIPTAFSRFPNRIEVTKDNSFTTEDESPRQNCCFSPWCWTEPDRSNIATEYFTAASMHGFRYVTEPKRHLSERIFWSLALLIALGASIYFISELVLRYIQNPVIVSFQPREQNISEIPFPAVTVCDMNILSKDTFNRLNVRMKKPSTDPLGAQARSDIRHARKICSENESFAKITGYAANRGLIPNFPDTENNTFNKETNTKFTEEIVKFIQEQTPPCDEIFLACVWSGKPIKCSTLFKPIITELGKCCSFNILPPPLSLRNLKDLKSRWFTKHNSKTWRTEELDKWSKWDYTQGYILDPQLERPRRQIREGQPFGLSFLLDGNTDRYFCTSTDSEGFKFRIHSPQENPQINYYGKAIELGKETYVEIKPKLTLADSVIEQFPPEKRQCVFPDERPLEFFRANNYANCLSECTSKLIFANCSCYVGNRPRKIDAKVCSSKPDSPEYICAEATDRRITAEFRNFCNHCMNLCSELKYDVKVASADLQPSTKLWQDHNMTDGRPPDWALHKLSIAHIYFSENFFVPRVRGQLLTITDLIGDTANVLTLCLGFSILSALEILYFFSCRVFFRKLRERIKSWAD